MEFPSNGHFSYITIESDPKGAKEVQYVYDDSEMVKAESDDYSNITELVLEDGPRAMIVNGTLVTADGQTLILQDGSDLSQYSVDDNADEIVISKDQEDQFLQIMSSNVNQNEGQHVIHYVQEDSGDMVIQSDTEQQIFYIQDGENLLPIQQQYQIAELDSQDSNESMQVINLVNDQMLDEVGGVIDLEQLLLSQEEGTLQLDGGNYQYAVLKDGKVHLQTASDVVNVTAHEIGAKETEMFLGQAGQIRASDYLDLSAIKGRNVKTGQVITLSRHMDKAANKKTRAVHVNNTKSKVDIVEKVKPNLASPNNNLRKLINKKITIGQTGTGKLLVGKIVKVMKKTDVNINKNKIRSDVIKNLETKKKDVSTPNRDLKKEVKIAKQRESEEIIINKEPKIMQSTNGVENLSQSITVSPTELGVGTLREVSSPKPVSPKKFTPSVDSPISKEVQASKTEDTTDNSKIIVHQKVVSKDCFDVITRTLTGLMNMDSVVKKLKNRTVIIKIIEKTYNQDKKRYSKTISYCSGYMVREYKLDDEHGNFSETWRFIPDANCKETILGQGQLEVDVPEGASMQQSLKKFANLTIQITTSPEGNKTTRVIINPPALFQCKACWKSFRTSALLKFHLLDCQAPLQLECAECPLKFETAEEVKEHSAARHSQNNTKGMYECMECNKCFQTPSQIRKHMDMHYNPIECVCDKCQTKFANVKELNKHLATHCDLNLTAQPEEEVDKVPDRKLFSCHICTRQFSRHSNLQRHIEIHQGEGAMYQCAVCSCSYHYISSLTRHVVSCHVDKSKKIINQHQTDPSDDKPDLQFLQDEQIVQMIPLEYMGAENLPRYVTENMQYVQDFQENEVQLLQIPVDSDIVIED